jgi:hypothetical protein
MSIIPADDRGFSADVDRMTVGADMISPNPMPCHVQIVYAVGFYAKRGVDSPRTNHCRIEPT